MWIMPSYNRPEAPGKLADAPGGMPPDVVIVINHDDPAYDQYVDRYAHFGTWQILTAPRGARFCEAVRLAFEIFPGKNYYGIIDDDYWPITPGWWDKMIDAAGGTGIAVANDLHSFPRARCRVMGGGLARAIGTIAPGDMRHNFSDDTWENFGQVFGNYFPLKDVIVEHRHHLFGTAEADETYNRGSRDFEEDKERYKAWLYSDERRGQMERVGWMLKGRKPSILDPRKVKLVVACATHTAIDPVYHHSMAKMQVEAFRAGMGFGEVRSYGGSHIGKARERVLWQAMEQDPTHILFVDDDMGFEPNNVIRLLMADVEFACGVGIRKTDNPVLCCNFYPGKQELHPVSKFVKIRDVGFAFVLLKRSVIDELCRFYPELRYNAGKDKDGKQKTEHALFLDILEDRERLSEDYSFCRRWTAIGGSIWADRFCRLVHAGRKEYGNYCIDDLFKHAEDVDLDLVQQ